MSRNGTERGVDFCTFMADRPLGEEKTAIGPDDSIIKATKSKKIYQLLRWKGKTKINKPQPTAPCGIDEFVNSDYTAIRGICDRCLRKVKAERVHIPTEK